MHAARSSRRPYVLAWVISAAAFVVWALVLTTPLGGPRGTLMTSDIGLALAALSAGVGCARAAWREAGRHRRLWVLLAASSFSWGGGQVVWSWYEAIQGREVPFPSFADVGYLGGTVFAVAALLSVPSGAQTLAGRIRTIIDGLMIAASLLLTSWVLVLGAVFRAGGDSALAATISLAYPIGDVIVITIVLYVLLRTRQTHRRSGLPLGLLAAGLVAMTISDSGFAYLTATNAYSSGDLLDSGWFVGYLLVLLASVKATTSAPPAVADEEETSRPLGLLLPYFAVAIAVGTTSFELVNHGTVSPFISWARTFILIAMVARQVLTLLENLSLTKHLEARVTERTSDLYASEQRFQALVQHSSDVVTVVDRDGAIRYQSDSVQRVFGYNARDLVGSQLSSLFDTASAARLLETLEQVKAEPFSLRVIEAPVLHQDGRRCHAEITITNLLDNPHINGLVLNSRDVSERKTLEEQLVHEAFHDSLTSLANRALFKDRVEHALLRRGKFHVSVLFLDLDGFKEVNDSLGHASGDLLLVAVAKRLRSCSRDGDTVARLGGDEFAVLMEDVVSELDPMEVAERMIERLREPFVIDGQELHVRASIGIAMAGHADDTDQLLRNADLAMYRAKAAQCGYECYDPGMHSDLVERLQIAADLRHALEAQEFVLHYQPTLALGTGEITGLEALIRWQHSTRGLVPPGQFIPLAEETGLIRQLGRWVLDQACNQAVEWQERWGALTMSVNISASQLRQADLVDDVRTALEKSGLAPSSLILEMTESVLMEHTEENLKALQHLKETGVQLAIDDFGTGYSSLSYLHRFPVDVLKIDRSFVERLVARSREAELIQTIVRLGQGLRLATVAEGIEDHRQFLALKRLGCELGQGFYFARPMPAVEVEKLLGEGKPGPAWRAGQAA